MRARPLNGGSPAAAHRDVGVGEGGSRHASRRFAAVASSVGGARRFLLSVLTDRRESGETAEGAGAAALMLSELATNAVRHASTDFEVTVDVAPDGRHVRVGVSDGAESFPVPRQADADASDGRGLHIVCQLADAWGVDVRRSRLGKTVWFCLALAAPAEADRTRAPGGRRGYLGAVRDPYCDGGEFRESGGCRGDAGGRPPPRAVPGR